LIKGKSVKNVMKIILFIVRMICVGKYAEVLFWNAKEKLRFKALLYYNWLYSSTNLFSVNVKAFRYKTALTCWNKWNHDFFSFVEHLTLHARGIKPVLHVQETGDHIMSYDYTLRILHPVSLTCSRRTT